jgi:glycosyltransferase involved in cell wall biosynthesis
MKVLVPTVSGATRPDGVSRHAINLARCLLHLEEIKHIDLVVGAWQVPYIERMLGEVDARLQLLVADTQRSSFARNGWYYNQLPNLAQQMRSDLVHATYPVPLDRGQFTCPVVVTLHDLYPYDAPHNFGYPRVFLNRLILRQCLNGADAIACVSDSTLARLRAYRPALMKKATRIYNCIEQSSQATFSPTAVLNEKSFLLSVAQHRRNKNIPLTLSVFRQILSYEPSLVLLLVGREGPETRGIRSLLQDSDLSSRVLLLDGITEEQLHWCYLNCKLLLATSTVEGFGLPVAEAMIAGCPVVCSDIPAFREIGEGYANLVPLGEAQEDAFIRAIRGTLHQDRREPVALTHLAAESIAQRYAKLYRGLLTSPHLVSANSFEFSKQKGGAV